VLCSTSVYYHTEHQRAMWCWGQWDYRGDGDDLHGNTTGRGMSYGNTVSMGTIMQQTAVLKLGNYSATVTVVLLYSIGLCTALQVFLVAHFSMLITLNSHASTD